MRFFIISVIVVLAGCQQHHQQEPEPSAPLLPTVANIQSLIGKPYASNVKSCQLIALGEKACGGPERYLVYSTETVDDKRQLLALVREYNRLSAQRKQGQFSTCEFIPRPQVQLNNGICEIQ